MSSKPMTQWKAIQKHLLNCQSFPPKKYPNSTSTSSFLTTCWDWASSTEKTTMEVWDVCVRRMKYTKRANNRQVSTHITTDLTRAMEDNLTFTTRVVTILNRLSKIIHWLCFTLHNHTPKLIWNIRPHNIVGLLWRDNGRIKSLRSRNSATTWSVCQNTILETNGLLRLNIFCYWHLKCCQRERRKRWELWFR